MSISPTLAKSGKSMDEKFKEKYEELREEMRNTYRFALLYPTFFMIRRIFYSFVLVFLVDFNYF